MSTPEEQQHEATHPPGIFHLDGSSFVIMRNTMPPRDPDEDKDEDNDEEDDTADEPPVVREPDND